MLGKCVGKGSSCEVYEWGGDDKVVKLFHTNTSSEAVQLEYRNSSAAWKSGLQVARPFEQFIWEGRPGIIFEKIVGETFLDRLFEGLYSFKKIDFGEADSELRLFARVLNDIHKANVSDIDTDQKDHLKAIIGRPPLFTNDEISAIHAYIDRLPGKRQLCHGDTNPNNLILREGSPVMIDWMHAAVGNPAADVAEVCVMIEYAVLPPETPASVDKFFQEWRQVAYRVFMDEYCRLSGVTEEEIKSWYVPCAARSIASGALSDEQIAKLASMIRYKLCKEDPEQDLPC
ncbi:aminoglycoside phosphotransferase family protein [Paenibacillus sp. HWE-109]|uniref:phosphotransferase family protein n=1 Tax=Paenibacillus sp. HWE-109 TaxID=1306526 RepID=UPI001EDF5FC2|nr:aminoglycoside phosphotransferase family protein [Paenibacillus sp. HWE-109]UKS28441.1 aminoglycoside phosphotransferase family protein [Paenibacillus sp. HWE-109]